MYTACNIFLLFIFYSFVGWLLEVLNSIIRYRKVVNRGFMIGPICPIYGVGALLVILPLQHYRNDPIALFFLSIALFSLLEYFTSFFMEKLFHARWCDYSKYRFNINGRICLETMIPFGILGVVLNFFIHPFVQNVAALIPQPFFYILGGLLSVIFLVDLVISTVIIAKFGRTVTQVYTDSTEEINNVIRKRFFKGNYLKRRLVKAFPTASPSPKKPKN